LPTFSIGPFATSTGRGDTNQVMNAVKHTPTTVSDEPFYTGVEQTSPAFSWLKYGPGDFHVCLQILDMVWVGEGILAFILPC